MPITLVAGPNTRNVVLTPSAPVPVFATFGLTGPGESAIFPANLHEASRFQNTAGTGLLRKLEILVGPGGTPLGNIRVGVYQDDVSVVPFGMPTVRLLDAGERPVANGWMEWNGLALPVTMGAFYWLTWLMSADNILQIVSSGVEGDQQWLPQSYGPLPNPFGGLENAWWNRFVMRATVEITG